jgi:hypothetical protein
VTSAVVNPEGWNYSPSPTKTELIRFACLVRDNAELKELGISKILRIVHQFHRDVPRASGALFFAHLVNELGLSKAQEKAALQSEDIAHAVSGYPDPVPAEVIRHLQRRRMRRY